MADMSGIQWRFTAYKVRLGPFDAMVVLPPLLLFFAHIKVWTFAIAIIAIVVMWVVELFFEMPIGIALKAFRSFIAGNRRPAIPWNTEQKL